MNAMVILAATPASPAGITLLLAGSLLAATLGLTAFVWAMVLVWRENHPRHITMRGYQNQKSVDDGPAKRKKPVAKILSLVGR